MALKVSVIAIGKFRPGPEQDLFNYYAKISGWKISLIELNAKKSLSGDQLKQAEAALILNAAANIPLLALDERGDEISSEKLASFMKKTEQEHGSLAICIGGADGLAEEVRKKAAKVVSLGRMTWPHMLVRAMLAEQIYRAWTISTGHPYHRA